MRKIVGLGLGLLLAVSTAVPSFAAEGGGGSTDGTGGRGRCDVIGHNFYGGEYSSDDYYIYLTSTCTRCHNTLTTMVRPR